MNQIFFTSDTHFKHANILKYENRPFSTIEEMDEGLIKNWNNKVSKNDSIYILGDFSFGNKAYTLDLLNKLNGQKFLIKGNHDHIVKDKEVADRFNWVKDYYVLKHNDIKFVLFHYPIQVWDCKHHGSIHLYGHIHSNIGSHTMEYDINNSYNVGTDVNNCEPISIDEILKKISYKKCEER